MVTRRPARKISRKPSSHALVQMQTFPNEWYARHARRILQERGPSAEAVAQLKALAASTVGQPAIQLRILLTQYAVGGLSESRRHRARAGGPGCGATSLDDPVGHGPGNAKRALTISVRRACPNRSLAGGPPLPGVGAAAPAARSAVEYPGGPGRSCRGCRRS